MSVHEQMPSSYQEMESYLSKAEPRDYGCCVQCFRRGGAFLLPIVCARHISSSYLGEDQRQRQCESIEFEFDVDDGKSSSSGHDKKRHSSLGRQSSKLAKLHSWSRRAAINVLLKCTSLSASPEPSFRKDTSTIGLSVGRSAVCQPPARCSCTSFVQPDTQKRAVTVFTNRR
ncbi:unnamed protein product [Soboliphyme baturini]|uniref:Uncharacterized protein n=1 Tax=Soboliphyme baturini TaxID=241478 RepID=A0A183J4K7_9BILA|nr:unnamed protein product [Soboliphyme baturini]